MSDTSSLLAPFLDDDGRLTAIPAKHKKKLAALWYLAQRVEIGRRYSEQEKKSLAKRVDDLLRSGNAA